MWAVLPAGTTDGKLNLRSHQLVIDPSGRWNMGMGRLALVISAAN
jgi:hypothetical protein